MTTGVMGTPTADGVPASLQVFEPSHAAALKRLNALSPLVYARTRNALDGAVSGLSPYFTHGLLGLKEAARLVDARHRLTFDDKLVFEWGWREFFHHVWSRAPQNGDAILRDMHGQLPWPGKYADTVPTDIREACTGVPAIDTAVRQLYRTGYLHNHARMWLASYVVHVRKVHWRAGADWLYAHLLDGDLPSNHLSWQWVAATFSGKPYLFNNDNVLKFAPSRARAAWDSQGTAIDQPYETLDVMARTRPGVGAERGVHDRVSEPITFSAPPAGLLAEISASNTELASVFTANHAIKSIAKTPAGQPLSLVHPWALAPRIEGDIAVRLGVVHLPAHAAWPWSAHRWEFVLRAMASVTNAIWIGDVRQIRSALSLPSSQRFTAQATAFPGYREALAGAADITPAPRLMPNPPMLCRSFTKFYEKVRRDAGELHTLL